MHRSGLLNYRCFRRPKRRDANMPVNYYQWIVPITSHLVIYIYIWAARGGKENDSYTCRKTSLTDHLHGSTTPLYRLLYLSTNRVMETIFLRIHPTTSLNRPFKVSPTVGGFRDGLLYVYICLKKYLKSSFSTR